MILRLLNLTLLTAAVVGAVFAWQQQRELSAARSEYQRLTAKVGVMPVGDETKIHVLAIDTDEPLHFLWRVYLPAKVALRLKWEMLMGGGGSSWSGGKEPQDFFVRCRFRIRDGRLEVFRKSRNSAGAGALGGVWAPAAAQHMEMLEFEQVAADGMQLFATDELIPLLKIRLKDGAQLPIEDDWQRKRLKELTAQGAPLASYVAGSQAAWAKAEGKQTAP